MVLLLEHMSLDARAATDVDAAIVSQVLRLDSMTKKNDAKDFNTNFWSYQV